MSCKESAAAELAFVTSLADPLALHELAVAGWLDDGDFIAYLARLLETWGAPELRSRVPNALALHHLASVLDGGRNAGYIAACASGAFVADQRRVLESATTMLPALAA